MGFRAVVEVELIMENEQRVTSWMSHQFIARTGRQQFTLVLAPRDNSVGQLAERTCLWTWG